MYVSPQDAFGLFAVNEFAVDLDSAEWRQILKQDPRRIVFILGISVPVFEYQVTTRQDVPLDRGFHVSTSAERFERHNCTDGPLTQIAWYAKPVTGIATLSVLEVLLNKDPCPEKKP